jgi:hypothetical protein
MHVRVWDWRHFGYRCRACGLAWPGSWRRCLDAPSGSTVDHGWKELAAAGALTSDLPYGR